MRTRCAAPARSRRRTAEQRRAPRSAVGLDAGRSGASSTRADATWRNARSMNGPTSTLRAANYVGRRHTRAASRVVAEICVAAVTSGCASGAGRSDDKRDRASGDEQNVDRLGVSAATATGSRVGRLIAIRATASTTDAFDGVVGATPVRGNDIRSVGTGQLDELGNLAARPNPSHLLHDLRAGRKRYQQEQRD